MSSHKSVGSRRTRYATGCPILVTIEYINAHLSEPLTLDDLVEVSTLSRHHFARSFKAVTGVTPMRFVLERRVEAAKPMLTGTTLSLCWIALECGFSSHAHFATAFRNVTGKTPSAWRAMAGVWLAALIEFFSYFEALVCLPSCQHATHLAFLT